LNLFLAMVLDAFDSSAIKKGEEDDELSKQFNILKVKLETKFKSLKFWFKTKIGRKGMLFHK
jgi:hypothetical protein